jgi:hypothetical protein
MFAGFGFDWPPVIVEIYRALSIFTFNIDLFAPECNISVNFEQKWYFIQALPLVMVASIAAAVVLARLVQWFQQRMLRQLPFGALASMNLLDVCFGIFITGVFMLYFST